MEKLLTDMLLTETNLMVMAGVFCFLLMINKAFPKISQHHLYKRLLPILPEILCTACLFAPGIRQEGQPWTVILLTGMILGVASSKFHKVFKQTLMGDDKDIQLAQVEKLKSCDNSKEG